MFTSLKYTFSGFWRIFARTQSDTSPPPLRMPFIYVVEYNVHRIYAFACKDREKRSNHCAMCVYYTSLTITIDGCLFRSPNATHNWTTHNSWHPHHIFPAGAKWKMREKKKTNPVTRNEGHNAGKKKTKSRKHNTRRMLIDLRAFCRSRRTYIIEHEMYLIIWVKKQYTMARALPLNTHAHRANFPPAHITNIQRLSNRIF